jgi:hypothetical protein
VRWAATEGSQLVAAGAGDAKSGAHAGTRCFVSSHSSGGRAGDVGRFRAEQGPGRQASRFVNLARPHCRQAIQNAMVDGVIPGAELSEPDPVRARFLGVVNKQKYDLLRRIYGRLVRDLQGAGGLQPVEADTLTNDTARLMPGLRLYFKYRATAKQLDQSYRSAQTMEYRASRFRAGG